MNNRRYRDVLLGITSVAIAGVILFFAVDAFADNFFDTLPGGEAPIDCFLSAFPVCDGACPDGSTCQPFVSDGADDEGGDEEFCYCQEMGGCCIGGGTENTAAECIVTSPSDCLDQGGLYLGRGSTCDEVDCLPLLVTYESIQAERTKRGVLITWTTESENDNAGFRVLRETTLRTGKSLMVVSPFIPAGGNSLTGMSYQFLDDSKDAATANHYYLEDIDLWGRISRHGPIEFGPRGPKLERKTPR